MVSKPKSASANNKRRALLPARLPIRRVTPNIITLLALCLGLTSIRMGLDGNFEIAVMCVVVACVLDAFDGRVARLLHAESSIGAQLDSLTDFLNFGVAPVFLAYIWALRDTGRFAWLVLLLYVACCALRLARFNTAIHEDNQPAQASRFFNGVPSPAAGGLVLFPLFLYHAELLNVRENNFIILFNVFIVAALMVSPIPTLSWKILSPTISRVLVLPMMLGAVLLTALLLTYPWATLSFIATVYYLSLPMSVYLYRRMAV